MKTALYKSIASKLVAIANCEKSGNALWEDDHKYSIEILVKNYMPSGSGFDEGTTLDFDASTPRKLVFNTAFHHMDSNGFYVGWTHHKVIVTSSLAFDFDMRITGKNRNMVKDFMYDVFDNALKTELEY